MLSGSEDAFSDLMRREVDARDVEFFNADPWSRTWLQDARYIAVTMITRIPKATRAEEYFAKTLSTTSTIPRWLDLVNRAILAPDAIERYLSGPDEPDVVLFVSLEHGVNGFRDTTHGGVLCALLDEVQSTCVELRRRTQSSDPVTLYTANLNVSFRRPVPTPGLAMVKAWFEGKQGRKWRARGVIMDAEGRICAEASSLWIAARMEKI